MDSVHVPAVRRNNRSDRRGPTAVGVTEAHLRALAEVLAVAEELAGLGFEDDGTKTPRVRQVEQLIRKHAAGLGELRDVLTACGYTPRDYTTHGRALRRAADLCDRVDHLMGVHLGEGVVDDQGRKLAPGELFPYLLRCRSARNSANCPVCGTGGRFQASDESAGRGERKRHWMCGACGGDVHEGRQILRRTLMDGQPPVANPSRATPQPGIRQGVHPQRRRP